MTCILSSVFDERIGREEGKYQNLIYLRISTPIVMTVIPDLKASNAICPISEVSLEAASSFPAYAVETMRPTRIAPRVLSNAGRAMGLSEDAIDRTLV